MRDGSTCGRIDRPFTDPTTHSHKQMPQEGAPDPDAALSFEEKSETQRDDEAEVGVNEGQEQAPQGRAGDFFARPLWTLDDSLPLLHIRWDSLFRGMVTADAERDGWALQIPGLLRVIPRACRSALCLFNEHFAAPEEFAAHESLFVRLEALGQTHMGIECDPSWRRAVLSQVSPLVSVRLAPPDPVTARCSSRVVASPPCFDHESQHQLLFANLRVLSFKVLRLNRESVRSMWAGQQNEVLFMHHFSPERGSARPMATTLRALVCQAADPPMGCPAYVSPVLASYNMKPT
ncbi:putative Pecanex protein [Paratrimastix pyriformis]|uniref:Pecanex protein n=1 Tax=Paratrimastix pyriformis TaxID=342808 RepID=A0ABQ8UVC8_9EUKA|nr:putative Pecanex protein [Paratrimastix pyriformis]